MKTIFFSYTLKNISLEYLKLIDEKFDDLNNESQQFKIYIDIFHNKYQSTHKKFHDDKKASNKSEISHYQKEMENNLLNSDLVCILKNNSKQSSAWVHYEYELARKNNIKLFVIDDEILEEFLCSEDVHNTRLVKLLNYRN